MPMGFLSFATAELASPLQQNRKQYRKLVQSKMGEPMGFLAFMDSDEEENYNRPHEYDDDVDDATEKEKSSSPTPNSKRKRTRTALTPLFKPRGASAASPRRLWRKSKSKDRERNAADTTSKKRSRSLPSKTPKVSAFRRNYLLDEPDPAPISQLSFLVLT